MRKARVPPKSTTPEPNRADEKLRASEALLAYAEQLANIGSWELDPIRQTVTWSEHFYRMLEREPEVGPIAYGRFTGVLHPDDVERARRDGEKMKIHGLPLENELRYVTSKGEVRIFLEFTRHSDAKTRTGG